jgi:hypothetical protein
MNQPEQPRSPAPEQLLGSMAAMRRAAQRARVLAQQTGTHIVVQRAGLVLRVRPAVTPTS